MCCLLFTEVSTSDRLFCAQTVFELLECKIVDTLLQAQVREAAFI